VRDNEPANFERVRQMLLPKDYVRFRLTGEFADAKCPTPSGRACST
jgi:sugar (pentulose or hexulose) kinase